MKDNPLAVVAGGVVIRLALGKLLLESGPERRVMGAKSDELVDRVQQAGRVKDVAVEAGRDPQDTVREEVSRRTPAVKDTLKGMATTLKDQLKSSPGRVAEEVKQEMGGSPSARDAGSTD